ncbi:MAG: HD domain-containing protein [Coriobacteriales bacterium]|nr:HD domain-containing protein [Coriobacteriales bacterium]
MDRQRAQATFNEYVSAYDPHNPRIALKVAHTLRVAQLCDIIAKACGPDEANLANKDVDLAWLCGILHDIGRFEQVRRYDTFNDAMSVSHATLGIEVLFASDADLLRRFVRDDSHDELIRDVVATHSDYRLPNTFDERTTTFCNVLRDADKIDILKVNCICPIQDIYGVSEWDMEHSELSPAVIDAFYERRTVPRDIRQYPADILVGHICFAWELVFEQSRRVMREQGYLAQMLSRRFANERTRREFASMAQFMRAELNM